MAFRVTQKVLFKHCDPAGIVFYPRYFEMMNDAVEHWFADLGHPFETLHRDHAVPTVAIRTDFRAASRHGDLLAIDLIPTRLGGSSLDLTLHAHAGGETRFEAHLTLVHIEKARMRATRWPDALRAALAARLIPQAAE
jgi:4-hydroxybenzoyl-CoA thioesterase